MGHEFLTGVIEPLAWFGGIAMIILASAKAKIENRKLDMRQVQPLEPRIPVSEDRVMTELKAMRQQMEQMQSTSHQFDISFDEALNRLEGRINRLETKAAVSTAQTTETTQTLRNGQTPWTSTMARVARMKAEAIRRMADVPQPDTTVVAAITTARSAEPPAAPA